MKNNLYFSRRSPVDMEEVREQLIENGANEAEFIKANKSIEDWFLYDFEGVKRIYKVV